MPVDEIPRRCAVVSFEFPGKVRGLLEAELEGDHFGGAMLF
jgi:hypothetical protein